MWCFWKKKRNKGSILLEAVAAVMILSIGLVTVMQAFASQRRAAVVNYERTRDTFLLADALGAAFAGLDRSAHPDVAVGFKALEEDGLGVKGMTLSLKDTDRQQGLAVWTYVKESDGRASF